MIIMTYVFLLPMMYSVQGNEISVHIDMNVNISKKQVTMDSDNCTSHTSPPGLWIASGVPGAPTCADFGAVQTNISGSGGQCYIFCKLQLEQKTRFFAWFWQALVDIFQQINPEPDPTTSAPTAIVPTTTTTTTTTKKTTKSTSEDVTWSPIRNACIKGNNYETYQPLTIDICKEKCVEEDAINCQSIEYSSAEKMCAISEVRSDSEDFIEPCHVDGWVFAEIELNADRTTGAPITTAPTNNTTNGPNTGPPTTTAPSNTTTNVTSCNLVWNYEEDRPLIMIWGGQTVIPPIIDIDISEDPNRFPEGIYLIFACPGENNIFKHIEGNHTKLHGECISHDKLQVCVNEYSEIMDLSNLSCRSKMHPSIIKQDNDTSHKKTCEDIGGELYKMGYIYGDKKEFKDLDTKVCFSEKDQTTLWTITNIDKIEISSSERYKDPTNFKTARGFAMKSFYSQKSQREVLKEVLEKEATSVWNEKACRDHGGHCVRGGKPCPKHLPHQTSQGEPFCSSFYRCCYSEQCDPTACTYKGKKGKCSLDSLPGTTGVGSQECKKGCQCYIKDNKTLHQLKRLPDRREFSKLFRKRCDGEDDCKVDNGGCDQICADTSGSPICSCNNGYTLADDGKTCDNKDCKVDNGGCYHICTDSSGSPICSCNNGYNLADDGKTCIGTLCEFKTQKSENKAVQPIGGARTLCNLEWKKSWEGKAPVILDRSHNIIPSSSTSVIPGTELLIFCPGTKFKKRQESILEVECIAGNRLLILTGQIPRPEAELKSLGCSGRVRASVDLTSNLQSSLSCGGTKTMYKIGFKSDDCFVKLIDVCFDKDHRNTKWTQHTLNGPFMQYNDEGTYRPGFETFGFEQIQTDTIYKPSSQFHVFFFLTDYKVLCYEGNFEIYLAKGHLSPMADFVTSAEQHATFFFMNVLPMWQSINNGNWAAIERGVRKYAEPISSDNGKKIKITTGGFDVLELETSGYNQPIYIGDWIYDRNTQTVINPNFNGQDKKIPVPAVLWKAIQGLNLVFVVMNNPISDTWSGLSSLPGLCDTIECEDFVWLMPNDKTAEKKAKLSNKERGRTFCCTISQFFDFYCPTRENCPPIVYY